MSALTKVLIAGLVALLLVSGYKNFVRITREGAKAEQLQADQKVMDATKKEARETLAKETARVKKAEQDLIDLKTQQEVKDAKASETIAVYKKRLRALADAGAGQLRDPAGGGGCGPDRGGAGKDPASAAKSGAGNSGQTGGLLSKPLTELLLSLTAEADAINKAYASCRADSYNVRGLPEPMGEMAGEVVLP